MATNKKSAKKSALNAVVSATIFDSFELGDVKEAEVLEYLAEHPLNTADFWRVHQRPVVAGCGIVVTFGEIIDAAEKSDVYQAQIEPGKVWNIIKGSIEKNIPFVLRKPFVIGFMADDCEEDENGMYVPTDSAPIVSLSGARHRAQAIYLMLKLSRLSDEEIRSMEVVALPEVYESASEIAQAIRDDNGSRTVKPTESLALKLQELSIDMTDDGLAQALTSKSLRAAEAAAAFAIKLVSEYKNGEVTDDDGEVIELAPNVLQLGIPTLTKLVQTSVSQASTNLKGAAKQLAKTPEGLTTLVDITLNYLGDALDNWKEYAKKNPSKDVNNLQRNATSVISSILTDVVESFMETYQDTIDEAEQAKAQKRKEALAKAREASGKDKKTEAAKPAAKKSTSKKAAAAPAPVEEEVDEEDSEDEEVAEEAPTPARKSRATAPKEVKKAVKPASPSKSTGKRRTV